MDIDLKVEDLEDAIIDELTELGTNRHFSADVEIECGDGLTVAAEVYGKVDEDGCISIDNCDVYATDADGEDVQCDIAPDICRIEDEATSAIQEAIKAANDQQETEDWLCWGGWFV